MIEWVLELLAAFPDEKEEKADCLLGFVGYVFSFLFLLFFYLILGLGIGILLS